MDTSQVSRAAVQAQLVRMLASETFRGAERSKTLLSFIVEETLQGRTDRLKDYTLGAEALGRGDQFDPRVDPIARVEASRLRSRLDMFYATEGAGDAVRISLPKGGYIPHFEARRIEGTPDAAPRLSPAPTWLWTTVGIAAGVALLVIGAIVVFTPSIRTAPPAAEYDFVRSVGGFAAILRCV